MRPVTALGLRESGVGFAHSLTPLLVVGALADFSGALVAQAAVHEHIAPRAPGFDLTTPPSKVSPLMNQADQIWNMGESPDGPDLGGARGQDPLNAAQPTYVPLLPGNGWQLATVDPRLSHYIGSFRNRGTPNPADDTRASFELVAPTAIEPGKKVVVAFFTHATFVGHDPAHAPHAYPGDPTNFDLLSAEGVGAHFDVAQRNLDKLPAPPYRIVGVQFVPRTSHRPTVSTMQRLRQVRKAVIHLLSAPPYNLPETDLVFHVDCASFGGFTTQLASIFYPLEFHSATAGAYSGAHRSMPSDYDANVLVTAGLGMDHAGQGYTMRDSVEIPMWCQIEQTDFTSVSFTNRWYRPQPPPLPVVSHIQRPIYFLIGDEDAVAHGNDWMTILNRGPGPNGTQPQSGAIPFTSVSGIPVTVRWSIVSKSGHGEPRPNEFTLMSNPPVQTNNLNDILDFMLGEAYAQLILSPQILPIDHASIGRKLTNQDLLPSLDPSRDALAHRGVRSHGPGTRPTLLKDPPATFRRYGQGTWLGTNESLKVKKIGNDPRASVFVGSADGFVTRLMVEPKPQVNPTIRPFVEQARSNSNGTPYALGHGTWGLDVGDVDPADGLEVVVGSHNRIALFRADNLALIREVELPLLSASPIPAEKRWEYVDPRKIQIADLLDDGFGEIVFRTFHGHLVIMDKALTIRHEHGDGSIIDFVVGPDSGGGGTWLKHPIYLLSARGHVARLEINTSGVPPFVFPNQGELAGASHLEYGLMRDLDLVTFGGQPHLAALFVPHLGTTDAMRFFRLGDCAKVMQFGDLQNDPPTQPPPPLAMPLPPMAALHPTHSGETEPSFTYVAGHGGDRYVISSGGHLSVWDGEIVLGHKDLYKFRPAYGHGCVQAGDIDDDPSSPGEEIVVATIAGKLAWFRLSDLTTPGLGFPGLVRNIVTDPADGVVYEHRCNVSLAATWAIAPAPAAGLLRVIDPLGTAWDVDAATGNPTYVRDFGVGVLGLVDAGASSVLVGSGGSPPAHRLWETLALGPITYVTSTPYVPVVLPGNAWWLPSPAYRPFIWHEAGHWVLPFGGTSYLEPGTNPPKTWLAWWQRGGSFTHFIQRLTYTVNAGQAVPLDIWGSTQRDLGGTPPPRFPTTDPDYVNPLRSEVGEVAPMNMETLRIGRVLPGDTPQVVASGMGGRVMVLDGSTGKIVTESPDYGLGGIALAVGNLDSDDRDEIVFAPFQDPIVPGVKTVRSTLRVLKWGNGVLTPLGSAGGVAVGEAGNADFPGYGTCGIAIVDLSQWEPLDPPLGKVVIVTTLNGELVIFEVQPDGSLNPQPLLRKVLEGSIGAYGSIVVGDLDPVSPWPELYLAGSSGIRRFDF